MTAIAACAGPAAARTGQVRRMVEAAPHRGPHTDVWTADGVQLGVRARSAVTITTRDGAAIAFTGRLDDVDAGRAALGAGDGEEDASIVLRAYARWGDEAPARLVGDFAFALWDAANARLVCARDALGQRPLFYTLAESCLLVASEPQQLLAHTACAAEINEGVVAEHLTGSPVTVDETVWRDVRRLRPAELLVADRRGVRRRRYWDFDPAKRLECRRAGDYDERFRTLFGEAIACRTRGESTVGVFLSGGLDSSAIAGVASARQSRGGARVSAYSLTFPGLAMDETEYIDAVVDRWSLSSVRLEARVPDRVSIEAEIDRYRDLPTYPNGSILDPLRARAARDARVVLTGYGGDDWFTGSPLHTTDLVREGRLLAALRQLRADAALPGRGYSVAGLLRTAMLPFVPRAVRPVLRRLAGRRRPFPWIRPEFAARVGLVDRLREPPPPFDGTWVQRGMHGLLNSLAQTLGDELEERAAAVAGLDQRHPFNDRRLAEFGFALPEAERWSGGETKVLIRRALAGVLPAPVRQRNDKAEFTPTLVQTLEALGGAAFMKRLRVADAGWVDAAVLAPMYARMRALYTRGEESYIPLADALWSVAAVELWLARTGKEQER